MNKGKGNGNTSGIEYSPNRIKRMNNAKKRTEKRWAAKSGPVTVRNINDEQK